MNPLWVPSPDEAAGSAMAAFFRAAADEGTPLPDAPYGDWHNWSVREPERFWEAVWRFGGVIASKPWNAVLVGRDRMLPPRAAQGPNWFIGARLNFAENLLRRRDSSPAIIALDERGRRREISFSALADEVRRFAGALRSMGVKPGDRVAGFMPNIPETVIAALGSASVGAVWSSCSPDFGAQGVLDRFGQIAPKVLVAADGYQYAGKSIDCLARVRDIMPALASVERVVIVPFLNAPDSVDIPDGAMPWNDFVSLGDKMPEEFEQLPFDHPLCIMYSSGTTGLPKCMVHGAGGTLLQHLKELLLHTNLRRDDRIFYFTTCGWMMWNWLVSALATESTIVLYDGAPMPESNPSILWDLAAGEQVAVFGTSAKYIALSQKAGLRPAKTHELGSLRSILSTGSPLADHSYDYVYSDVHPHVHLASISGGTDIISCFALGNPMLPVWRGELQCRGLGMAVEIWDENARPVRGVPGELVCVRPFPSMPVAFWDDPGGEKYSGAYFSFYEGQMVWRHGDWAELTEHDGLRIHGRSDATLNPGGVRIGTAEIYRQVEQLPEIVESVVVGEEFGEGSERDVRIVLFVRLREGVSLDDALRDRIRKAIRSETSPHHVPRAIHAVPDIPRTISGKISEIAVREVLHGRPVKNTDALANPDALEYFRPGHF